MREKPNMEVRLWARSTRLWSMVIVVITQWITCTEAAFVEFSNCLDQSIVNSKPRVLQFVPLNITAFFNASDAQHNLNITVYGNVTGQLFDAPYPPPDDPSWRNPDNTTGKIVDVSAGASVATTLFTDFNVLTYTPYSATPERFCEETVNDACPLAPAFYTDSDQIAKLPGYTVAHQLFSSYAFTTIAATTKIQSGLNEQYYGCVTAYITPDLGDQLRALLRYLPLGILTMVGIATVGAAMFSPWGSLDIFHWSSNFGRDEDVLRLVTPGFADCLQYIQFIVLTGSLSLNYPGFYQPVVSRVGWSTLLFNESLVSGGSGISSVVDGLYVYRANSRQGLDRMTQSIGMASPRDAWADMMVWFVVIILCVLVLTQLGFLLRWIYRQVMHVPPEDLRSKNWYFCVGNVVRITMGFFLLPLIALSMYQFVISSQGPTVSVALAAVVIAFIIACTVWLIVLFVRTRPRSYLFDDLQTVLAYGPLYNTYRDDTATFALVPILVTFIRGIAIGAVQDSGVAQIVLLAICEVVMVLTINAFRPFPAATSMNVYHTCFSIIRLLTVLLAIAFVPSLSVTSSSRGWIGYAILLIHACVLVFGFFLNAVQTLIEVIARLAGAGGSGGRDAARGGLTKVFGMRQLSKRLPRRETTTTQASMASDAHILAMQEAKAESVAKTRSRSVSASSTMLLDGNGQKAANRNSQILDGSSAGRITPDAVSTFSGRMNTAQMSPGGIVGIHKQVEAKDPYYRQPRRNTNEMLASPPNLLGSRVGLAANEDAIDDGGEGSSVRPARADDPEEAPIELTRTKTDYAVREVDFYYRVRGPALSSGTRKLKTGPADPTGPVSSARGWFKGLMGGKTKEKGKGFEVVRSAKAPVSGTFASPTNLDRNLDEPYRDQPERRRTAMPSGSRRSREVSPDSTYRDYEDIPVSSEDDEPSEPRNHRPISSKAPALPQIDPLGAIELPSRIGSQASRKHKAIPATDPADIPPVPRRSSRRTSNDPIDSNRTSLKLPAISALQSSTNRESYNSNFSNDTTASSSRFPFANKYRYSAAYSDTSAFHSGQPEDTENQPPDLEERPGSIGFVNQHRASDSIKHSPDEAQNALGSSAEFGHSAEYLAKARHSGKEGSRLADDSAPYRSRG